MTLILWMMRVTKDIRRQRKVDRCHWSNKDMKHEYECLFQSRYYGNVTRFWDYRITPLIQKKESVMDRSFTSLHRREGPQYLP